MSTVWTTTKHQKYDLKPETGKPQPILLITINLQYKEGTRSFCCVKEEENINQETNGLLYNGHTKFPDNT